MSATFSPLPADEPKPDVNSPVDSAAESVEVAQTEKAIEEGEAEAQSTLAPVTLTPQEPEEPVTFGQLNIAEATPDHPFRGEDVPLTDDNESPDPSRTGPVRGFTAEDIAVGQAEFDKSTDQYGNTLVPREDAQGNIVMVSPVSPRKSVDPFPLMAFPDHKRIVKGLSGSNHGGHLRTNPDGSVSFKPTSYVGPIVTAPSIEELALP